MPSLALLLSLTTWVVLKICARKEEQEFPEGPSSAVKRAERVVYSVLLFPVAAGFLLFFLLAAYINMRRLGFEGGTISSPSINAVSQLAVVAAIALVAGEELLSAKGKGSKLIDIEAKGWYVPCFLFKNLLLMTLFSLFISNPQSLSVALILGLQLLFFLFLLVGRPYTGMLQNIGVLLWEATASCAVALSFVSYITSFSGGLWSNMALVLQGLIIVSSFISMIRLTVVYVKALRKRDTEKSFYEEGEPDMKGRKGRKYKKATSPVASRGGGKEALYKDELIPEKLIAR